MNTTNKTVPAPELNLIKAVGDLLANAGLIQQAQAHYHNNSMIIEAQTFNEEGQRFLLNRYWNLQLLASPQITVDERYCLVPNGTTKDWLRLFEQKVLPFCVENNLPNSF